HTGIRVKRLTAGTCAKSTKLRCRSPMFVFMPRRQKITLRFPSVARYSAAFKDSSSVMPKPRLINTGNSCWRPTNLSSSKFCITLAEPLNAAEYLATEGNRKVIFCLRGMKTNMGDPHRNFVDFAHVPVVKRLTRMPVCIDPSHSVGTRIDAPDGLLDIFHVVAQGIIAGANVV